MVNGTDKTTASMARAIRIGCGASDIHLTCTYPECSCRAVPRAVKAGVEFAIRDAVKEILRGK